MFYFFHATTIPGFESIVRSQNIYASAYLNLYNPYSQLYPKSQFVYTNIYVDGLPLKPTETSGFGPITLIIDPIILKYRTCYFHTGWQSELGSNTIIMNNNIPFVLEMLHINYRYPYILTHEALFRDNIPFNFVIGVICDDRFKKFVREYLDAYGYYHIRIFDRFPHLIR